MPLLFQHRNLAREKGRCLSRGQSHLHFSQHSLRLSSSLSSPVPAVIVPKLWCMFAAASTLDSWTCILPKHSLFQSLWQLLRSRSLSPQLSALVSSPISSFLLRKKPVLFISRRWLGCPTAQSGKRPSLLQHLRVVTVLHYFVTPLLPNNTPSPFLWCCMPQINYLQRCWQ